MTGETHYHRIPILTKLFKINFYIRWEDGRFNRVGFERDNMSFADAIARLERKRAWRDRMSSYE